MFIRLWAPTDTTQAAITALHYARILIRFQPVRLVTLTGVLDGAWGHMHRLLETPMITPMINVVCAKPEHWIRHVQVGMPKQDNMQATLATGKQQAAEIERADKTIELWTQGVRNVLIALELPDTRELAESANKYDAVICPTPDLALAWTSNQVALAGRADRVAMIGMVPPSPDSLRTLRDVVLGPHH